MSRLRELPREQLSEIQQALFDAITTGKRSAGDGSSAHVTQAGGLRGPFNALLRAPHVGDLTQQLGERLRFEGLLAPQQREIAVLCVAAYWKAGYEWWAHSRIALECGVPEAVIGAIQRREQPRFEESGERLVHDFSRALLDEHRVSDTLYRDTVAVLGEATLVELVVLLGYYSLISMVLVGFDVRIPDGAPGPFD